VCILQCCLTKTGNIQLNPKNTKWVDEIIKSETVENLKKPTGINRFSTKFGERANTVLPRIPHTYAENAKIYRYACHYQYIVSFSHRAFGSAIF
jgi:hypothetical protein